MKKIFLIAAVLILSLSFRAQAQSYGNNEFGYFYNSLSPYGSWIELNQGVMAWQPYNVRRDWVPYRDGRWIWTDDGWFWDSYEPFGYIVFHYGRWYYDNYYGWLWIPDYKWAPAWVEWRYDNNYIGWAPLPPYASFSVGIGIHFSLNYVTPYRHWHFVRYGHFCNSHVYRYFVGSQYKYRIFSRTKYRTNYGYSNGRVINRGVNIDYIRQRSGQRIMERKIERVNNVRDARERSSVRNDRVRAYIPSREQMASSKVREMKVKRATRRSTLDVSRVRIGNRGNAIRSNRNETNMRNRESQINRNRNRELNKTPNSIRRNNSNNRERNNTLNRRTPIRRNEPQIRNERKQRVERRPSYNKPQTRRPSYSTPPTRRQNNIRNERPSSRVQRHEVRRAPSRSSTPQVRRNEVRRAPSRSSAPQVRRETRSNRSSGHSSSNENRRRRR